MPRVYVVSLGCPKNRVDTEYLVAALAGEGYSFAAEEHEADLIVVNTCAFIEDTVTESVDTILELVQSERPVYVVGCLVQRYRERLKELLPDVAGFFGPVPPDIIIPHLATTRKRGTDPALITAPPHLLPAGRLPRVLSTPVPYAYLKIAEGCSHNCSFCLIPQIRGDFASRPEKEILAEARWLAETGVEELIVVAQDTTRWGRDLEPRKSLSGLLDALAAIEGFHWIRVLYLNPTGLDNRLLDAFARGLPLVPYFDIPFQHSSKRVLRSMGRAGDGDRFLRLIEKVRAAVPGAVFRTTLMVGFPGETDEDFSNLLDFVRAARVQHLGVFRFSPEEGVKAAGLPGQLPKEVKSFRIKEVMKLQAGISRELLSRRKGLRIEVVKEGQVEDGTTFARAAFQAPEIDGSVLVEDAEYVEFGEFFEVTVTLALKYDLVAKSSMSP